MLNGLTVREAKAAFVGDYALGKWTLTNSFFANGQAISPDGGLTLILTGPNDGSGEAGTTDFTIAARADGFFRFDYLYTSLDDPGFDLAGYLLGTTFHFLADTSGQSGTSITVPVLTGDNIGFRIQSFDNMAEPGVLTITNFSAPTTTAVPEPGGFSLALLASVVAIAVRKLRGWRSLGQTISRIRNIAVIAVCAVLPMLAQPQTEFGGTNVTGQLVLTRVVNARQQALAAPAFSSFSFRAASPQPEKRPKAPPKRLRPSAPLLFSSLGAPALSTFVTPIMKSLTVAGAAGISGFNALSHLNQRLANNGNQFSIEPPSASIAVGNGFVLEGVNDAIQVYSVSGAPALPVVISTNQLFGLGPAIDRNTDINGVYLTDMRVYFDHDMARWFVIQRSQDNDVFGFPLNQSHLYMAVSKTADPTGDYNIYIMDTTNPSYPGCPCIADYPQIGSDQYGFHIAWNQFNTFTEGFVSASILSLSKASLASSANLPTAYRFNIQPILGYEFALQPATTPPGASPLLGSGGVVYFTSTSTRTNGGLALWALRNTSSLATPTPNPILARTIVTILPYTPPGVAAQKPGPIPYGSSLFANLAFLDGGDNRVQALSYSSGRLYLTFPTSVNDENGRNLVGGAFVVLSPSLRSGVLGATVINQGYLIAKNNNLLFPAIAVNAQGKGAISTTLVGPDWHPSAALIPFETFTTPTTLQVAKSGARPQDGFTGYEGVTAPVSRWGDYNGAVATSDGAIWMVVEYIGDYPRTEFANWNTYVMRKQP